MENVAKENFDPYLEPKYIKKIQKYRLLKFLHYYTQIHFIYTLLNQDDEMTTYV